MIKRVLATGAVAASVLGLGATQAMAMGDDSGTTSVNGNGAPQSFGNAETHGDGSPQFGLVQGSLNKPCVGLPAKANGGSLVGLVPVTAQDVNVLASSQSQQCTENSAQAKGDEPLSHTLSGIPVLAGNGTGNS
ncbi:rodlin [Streptomyces sp. NBC_01221]|uniref:rodlin n=1 Tax=unclassified Streptomyces TaxID=2593676 RepID=UPI00225287FD|nr:MULTISPECIES: rodlin [unclassified Streptomyces]MCX4790162.1 rodlin [Streptomyces sp. NBC_01221]MCX4794110.1 rodlin [Streptomyces sp. NBC_01242]WSJ35510.1 rodlin [Streptomyces sp. NBC_01321]WSP58407.1 rodlin [Streptomyces sp. NBC_01241]